MPTPSIPPTRHTEPSGFWPLADQALTIELLPDGTSAARLSGESPAWAELEERTWERLRRENPRLHDGPILAVRRFDPASATLTCARDRYRALAVQHALTIERAGLQGAPHSPMHASRTPIYLLGVKGCVIGVDAAGDEHLLIARRGASVRVYPMQWESAPAGGVDPPSGAAAGLSTSDLLAALQAEAEEELGRELDWGAVRTLGVYRDADAASYDVFLRLDLRTPIDPRAPMTCQHAERSWEYVDVAWLAQREARVFVGRAGGGGSSGGSGGGRAITPPTLALLARLGWA